jgi:hypothetical protein
MKHFFKLISSLVTLTVILSAGAGLPTQAESAALSSSARLHAVLGPTLLGHKLRMKATALKVEMVRSDDTNVPAEFQVALYENVIQQLQNKLSQVRVYRDGDRNAADIPDLVVLHSSVRTFTRGSEEKRQVTRATSETVITVHCQFTDTQGRVLVERDIQGKVRSSGANLKATNELAKKAATLAHDEFSAGGITQPRTVISRNGDTPQMAFRFSHACGPALSGAPLVQSVRRITRLPLETQRMNSDPDVDQMTLPLALEAGAGVFVAGSSTFRENEEVAASMHQLRGVLA